MTELVRVSETREVAEVATLSPRLYEKYVAWVDRGERTTRTYLNHLRQWAAYLAYMGINQPVRDDVIAYREWLGREHDAISLTRDGWTYRTDKAGHIVRTTCKAGTVVAYLQAVKAFFKWTAAEGLYPDIASNVHSPKIGANQHSREALQAGDVLAVEASIQEHAADAVETAGQARKDTAGRVDRATEQGKRLHAMYMLAVNAGLRTVEMHRADVRDLVSKGGQTYLWIQGKGHAGKDTKKVLAPAVAEVLRDYLNSRKDGAPKNSPLFVSTGNRSGGQRIATTTISTMLKRALQDAGYDDDRLTAHSLRHTAGTAAMETKGLYAAQGYLRHVDPKTTERYIHDRKDVERDAETASAVYAYYHGQDKERERLISFLSALDTGELSRLAGMAATA